MIQLIPTFLALVIIFAQNVRGRAQDQGRMKNIEEHVGKIELRLDAIHDEMLLEKVFQSELNNVNGKIAGTERRLNRLEDKVFNGTDR